MHGRTGLLLALSAAAAFAHAPALAQQRLELPGLEEIPAALPESPRAALTERRRQLANGERLLISRTRDYNTRCLVRTPNSVDDRECPDRKVRLYADVDAHVAAAKSFNWDLEQAIGDERIRLERRIRDTDEALRKDAEAIRRFGFDRRAEDFERWARLSNEAKTKAVDKLLERLFETGGDAMREGIFGQLTSAGPQDIDRTLLRLRAAGLGGAMSFQVLSEYQRTGDRNLLQAGAKHLSEDLRSVLKGSEAERRDERFEAAFEALVLVSPPPMRAVLEMGETAAWATFGAGVQVIAVTEVSRLNKLTCRELQGIRAISCLVERRVQERYETRVKLAELMETDVAAIPMPIRGHACVKREPLKCQ